MKLIEFDGMEFKIADEALLVRPIRELFQKDKTKKKEEFWKQISYIFFMCDPRSTYMYLMDEDERSAEICKQEGFGEEWKPSPLLMEAMNVYRKHCVTTASLLLDDMRYALDSIRLIIRRIGLSLRPSAEDENTNPTDIKLDKALDSMTKAAEKIPDLARKLVDAEKELAKDFETDDKARGNASKAVGEDI